MKLAEGYKARYSSGQADEMSLEEYLELCRKDPGVYSTAAERMLAAIGEPEVIDTRHDPRLSRIFGNKMVRIYPAFKDFYGLEEPIEQGAPGRVGESLEHVVHVDSIGDLLVTCQARDAFASHMRANAARVGDRGRN